MSPEMSEEQRRTVLWRLLEGLSYTEVAAVTGASPTAVAQVWQEFGQGRMPGFKGLSQYAQRMRELAVELHRAGIAPGGASLVIQSAQALARTGVEPQRLQEFVALCERLAGGAAHDLVQAALSLQQLETQAGQDYNSLVASAQEIWDRVQDAESRLAAARKALEEMEALGLPASELPALAARLAEAAQRHQLAAEEMLARLFDELERLDQGMTLRVLVDSCRVELTRLENEIDDRRARVTQLQYDNTSLEDRASARRAELAALDSSYRDRQAEADQLEATLSALQQDLAGMVEAGAISRERLESDLRRAGDEASAALDALLGPRKEALSQLENAIVRSQSASSDLEASLSGLRQELASLVETATVGRERLEADARHVHDETTAVLDRLTTSRRDALSGLEDAIAKRRIEAAQLEAALSGLRQEFAGLVEAATAGRERLEVDVRLVRDETSALLDNMVGSRDSFARGQAEAAQLEAALSGLRQEFAGLVEAATAGKQRVESDVQRATDDTAAVLDGLVTSRKDDIARVDEAASALRSELGQLVDSVALHKQYVSEEARRAAEEAAATLRQGTADLRQELNDLRQETLELAGRSARIDADIRSREWLSRLLSLLEGKDDVRPEEVRALTLAIVEPLQGWLGRHQGAFNASAQDGLVRLRKGLEG